MKCSCCSSYLQKLYSQRCVASVIQCEFPVCSRQENKGKDEGKEDHDEADVNPQSTDDKDKREESHEQGEEACAISKRNLDGDQEMDPHQSLH